MPDYENPQVEPFTVRRINGVAYYRPSHKERAWYADGYAYIADRRRDERKSQRKLTIEQFLAEVPDLCYAPVGEEAQEALMLYLDTEWMETQTSDTLNNMSKLTYRDDDAKHVEQLMGTIRTLKATEKVLIEMVERNTMTDWFVEMEAKLRESLPGARLIFTKPGDHPHVVLGRCEFCGHYGDDCTGTREAVEPDFSTEDEFRAAAQDRAERPWVVGEVENPGVIERFATHDEASAYIEDSFPAEDVQAGRYYIDGPSDDELSDEHDFGPDDASHTCSKCGADRDGSFANEPCEGDA